MTPRYHQKIVTIQELAQAIGPRPREKTVVMCHGAFDIVHPGHLRHLAYAKEKADLLIASLTADEHILKADYRPYVPQELRAQNLAALEIVDFVIIDPNPTPIEHIKVLQPDLFAKGYEYTSQGLPPKTQEEKETVESYGGDMLFTPGDLVYSSSAIIDSRPPRIQVEKLLTLMEMEDVSFSDLRAAERELASLKVHVIGDTIVSCSRRATSSNAMSTPYPPNDARTNGRSPAMFSTRRVSSRLRSARRAIIGMSVTCRIGWKPPCIGSRSATAV